MVLIGSALVFAAGSTMMDSLESQADREQVRLCADETDHRIGTVASTGKDQPLEFDDPDCQPDVAEEGSIELVWFNSSTESPPWTNDTRTVSGELGALEFDLDDRTIAHQGGGIWEFTGSETTVVSEPQISYDNESQSLRLNIMQLEEEALQGSDPIARADYSKATNLTEEIATAAARSPEGTDVAFRIESPYYEGWEQFLEGELGEYADVTTDPNAETVTVTIKDVRDPFDPATFIVVEDRGLFGPNGKSLDQRVDKSSLFRVGGIIKNTGDRYDKQTVSVSIWDSSLSTEILSKDVDVGLDPGETENLGQKKKSGTAAQFQPGAFKHKLTPGETYKYKIETDKDDLNTPGTFYYGKKKPYFELSKVSAVNASQSGDGNVTISGDVQQIGTKNTTDRAVDLELEYLDGETPSAYKSVAPVSADGTYGVTTPVEWRMNASKMFNGRHKYTIDTGDENVTGTFTVNTGVDSDDSEVYLEPGNTVNVSVLGTEISAETPTRRTRNGHLRDDIEDGEWRRDAGNGWDYNVKTGYRGEARWNDAGGWQSDGEMKCAATNWMYSCTEYEFVDAEKIWWDSDGGWDLQWTESRNGDWAWDGPGDWGEYQVYEKNWAPVTVDIVTRPVDEDGEPTGDRNVIKPDDWTNGEYGSEGSSTRRNLNTHDTREQIWDYSFTTDERVSLTLSSTLYGCGRNYETQNVDTYTDGEYYDYHDTWSEYNGNGYWEHNDCLNTGRESLSVDATTDSNGANVRVRDSENNLVPELRAGHQRQHSADEVLERADRDLFGGELEDGTGYLDLKEGQEFVFMMELTEEAARGTDPDEFWEQAKETDSPGDPNFNDVIVLVEVDSIPADIEGPVPVDGDGTPVDVGAGDSDSDPDETSGANPDTGVDVDTDHIVIG
uniref:DUF7289 family protein n=1 Tax=Halopiger djelfimassiliensis TaxID=1293047 RepID=UPI001E4B6F1E|nr:flagellin [Halopiger djelfimassiliensis]